MNADTIKRNGWFRLLMRIMVVSQPLWVISVEAATPVANAGGDRTVEKNQVVSSTIQLDGSGSSDADGDPLTYWWYGPFGAIEGKSPNVILPEGRHAVSLVVHDGSESSPPDLARIDVVPCLHLTGARAKRGKVQLTWRPVPGAIRYLIYRASESNPGQFARIAETVSNYSTYLDTTVANEQGYLYTVGVESGHGTCYSDVVAAYPTAIRGRHNHPPLIYSHPSLQGTRSILYTYDLNAADPNGDLLSYRLADAPPGMQIDPSSGLIEWTPDQTGEFSVRVEADDGRGGLTDQSFTIHVQDQATGNHPPIADAGPDQTVLVGDVVQLDATGSSDADGDTLTYAWRMRTIPPGSAATLSDATDGHPTFVADKAGQYVIELIVNDGLVDSAPDTVTIDASSANQPPAIVSMPPVAATERQLYQYDVQATDPDPGDTLVFSLDDAPAGMTIDPATGLISWTPATGQAGDHAVTVRVTDAGGLSASQTFTITVTPGGGAGDRDGDGIPDQYDAFPDDPNDAYDFDQDGVGDNADPDRDGDGVDNNADFYPDDPAQSAAPQLQITTPADGATIAEESVIVEGALDAPWNTGITINGLPALRGGTPWGSEFALRVPLQTGSNSIEIVATGQSGKQISRTLTVTRSGRASFRLNAAPSRAFAPAEILFMANIPAGLDIVQADWDFDGDGVPDSTRTTHFEAPVTHNYTTAGLYHPSLTLTDSQNQTYTRTLVISIIDQTALDDRLKTLWADMMAALTSKNLGLAQSFLMKKAEGGYEKVFYLLLPFMPTIVPGFSPPQTVETGLTYAEYAIGETIDGTDRVFLIQLLRDARGVWKVEGM